jgi:tripartite-type tricarboxylate transporter receptor subunit TctC
MIWYVIYAPMNMPVDILQKLYSELRKATDDQGVKSAAAPGRCRLGDQWTGATHGLSPVRHRKVAESHP